MTTSSGKPPFDEKSRDSSWDAGDGPAGGPDSSSLEPPTQRHPALHSEPPDAGETAPVYGAGVPYGGDDHTEEIEPIALDMPFAADRRKTPPAPGPGPVTPRMPSAAPLRNYEMAVPNKQLNLSDLFDSTPSGSALAPPDPSAFSSSRPPPVERAPAPVPAPAPAIVALPSIDVGGAPRARVEPEAPYRAPMHTPSQTPVRPPMHTPVSTPVSAPLSAPVSAPGFAPGSSPVAAPLPPASLAPASTPAPAPVEHEPKQRRSVPPLESFDAGARLTPTGTLSAKTPSSPLAARDFGRPSPIPSQPLAAPAAPVLATPTPARTTPVPAAPLHAAPSHAAPSHAAPSHAAPSHAAPSHAALSQAAVSPSAPAASAQPLHAPSGSAQPSAAAAFGALPGSVPASSPGSIPGSAPSRVASESHAEGVVRFASEVPTSRPPDVVMHPAAHPPAPAPSPSQRAEPRSSRESVPVRSTVVAPVTTQAAKAQLPSIMLADDVEAEPDSSARRALRAARATVRLELPPNFGRPGSPTGSPPTSFGAATASSSPGVGAQVYPRAAQSFASSRTRRLLGIALAAVLVIVVLIITLSPRTGSLVVTALAPGNRAVDDVTIFIDDKPLCDVSPCRIKGLAPGVHTLRASAPNLASQAEETVEISAGDEATYNIDLLAVAPELRGGNMRVGAAGTPFTLYVDGKRVGKLPQEVSGLSSGKHWIKLDPEDGSAAIEKSVNVLAGETVDVEPKAAKRDKALVTIRLGRGSEGALVTFDDAFLLDFPAELELEPGSAHTLSATKPGFDDLNMEVKLGSEETEKLIEVALTPAEGGSPGRKARAAKAARKPVAAAKAPTATASTALVDATQGLLNISSVPPSQIILNGRPLGSTPKTGIVVPGDSLQTIVFVHPKMGRRRAQKFVPAGKERTVAIRF